MAISLYDATVACYLQTLGGVVGFLDKGAAHFKTDDVDLNEIVESRLIPDMLPFRFQVQAVAHHSLGAVEGVRKGIFLPPASLPPHDYHGLQKLIGDTREALKALSPAEINGFEGKDVTFEIGGRKIPFLAEGFFLSFSLPNFHFHAATAYDILRMRGVPIGKRDYLGALKLKS
jgi:hypothetical protein